MPQDYLKILPDLKKLISKNKFALIVYDNKPIIEMSRLPVGVTIEKLNEEKLWGELEKNNDPGLKQGEFVPGFLLNCTGQDNKELLYIYHINHSLGINHICNIYMVEKNTSFRVAERFWSFSNDINKITSHWTIMNNANVVKYTFGDKNLNTDSSKTINSEIIRQFSNSNFKFFPLYFSSGNLAFNRKTENNLIVDLNGENADCKIYSMSILSGDSSVENSITIKHSKPNCQSLQLFKGVYNDFSFGVFDSCVIVEKNAQKSYSVQKNNNIILSNSAYVQSNPKLEIFADDVECAHGSTTGQIDPTALFYLRSRGLSKAQANSLLLNAFLMDVVDEIEDPLIKIEVCENILTHF